MVSAQEMLEMFAFELDEMLQTGVVLGGPSRSQRGSRPLEDQPLPLDPCGRAGGRSDCCAWRTTQLWVRRLLALSVAVMA